MSVVPSKRRGRPPKKCIFPLSKPPTVMLSPDHMRSGVLHPNGSRQQHGEHVYMDVTPLETFGEPEKQAEQPGRVTRSHANADSSLPLPEHHTPSPPNEPPKAYQTRSRASNSGPSSIRPDTPSSSTAGAASAGASASASASSPVVARWTTSDLWAHLDKSDGVLSPMSRANEAKFAWEKLFLALGVDPPKYQLDPANPTHVDLQIDGQVLCHLINLYAIRGESRRPGPTGNAVADGSYETWLGNFGWTVDQTKRVQLNYSPRSFRENTRHPIRLFSSLKTNVRAGILDLYSNTLVMGVSDPSYEWPEFPAPLIFWIDKLASNLTRISQHRPDKGPLIITPTWLAVAKFVKNLICFDGNNNHALLQDVLRELDRQEFVQARGGGGGAAAVANTPVTPLEERSRGGPTGNVLLDVFQDTLDPEKHFRLIDEDDKVLTTTLEVQINKKRARETLLKVLYAYWSEPTRSWKRTLFEKRTAVCDIVLFGMDVPVDETAVIALPFDMESGLWEMGGLRVNTPP